MASIPDSIWLTIQQEFGDIPDVTELTRISLRLAVALLLGGLLGYEREAHGKSAGLRTHMLVSMGAALFVLMPLQAGMSIGDLSRVIQGVVAGIGFLGAGTIMKRGHDEIHGLTTAASIWVAAAVGIAAGAGHESTAVLATLFALFTLSALKRFAQDTHDAALDRTGQGDAPAHDDEDPDGGQPAHDNRQADAARPARAGPGGAPDRSKR